jgi:hypothetical protein
MCGAAVEMRQDRIWPAILFGFFWVAMRQRTESGENGVCSAMKDPKHANPAIKVLWSSKQEQERVRNRKSCDSMQCVPGF